jgi:uncharacterized protein
MKEDAEAINSDTQWDATMPEQNRHFIFRLSKDKMSLVLEETDSETGFTSIAGADEILKQMGLQIELSLEELARNMEKPPPVENIIIAKGIPPIPGKDGYLDLQLDLSAKPRFLPDISEEELQRINYRESMKMEIVQPEDLIAQIVAPQAGTPGKDLTGKIIMPPSPQVMQVIAGEGTVMQGNRVHATRMGFPRLKDNVLSVHDVLDMNSDISYESGNIKFPGTVYIHGDVLPGFEVDAGMDVRIWGKVDGGTIRARGNVKIFGGVVGKGKTLIKAGGNIECKFCDRATLEAEGSIYITKDLLHSQTKSLGEVRVNGCIIGGEVMSLRDLWVQELGNSLGTVTHTSIFKHYRREKALEESNQVIYESNDLLQDCRGWVRTRKIPDSKLHELKDYIQRFSALFNRKKRVEMVIEKFDKQIEALKFPIIHIGKKLHPDVVATAPHCITRTMKTEQGPLVLKANVDRGVLEIKRG